MCGERWPVKETCWMSRCNGIEILRQRQFGLSRNQEIVVKCNGRLLGLMAISNQSAENIDKAIDWRTMTRMLDLRNVLQLVDDGFDNRALVKGQTVIERHQSLFHIALELRYEMSTTRFSSTFGGDWCDRSFDQRQLRVLACLNCQLHQRLRRNRSCKNMHSSLGCLKFGRS